MTRWRAAALVALGVLAAAQPATAAPANTDREHAKDLSVVLSDRTDTTGAPDSIECGGPSGATLAHVVWYRFTLPFNRLPGRLPTFPAVPVTIDTNWSRTSNFGIGLYAQSGAGSLEFRGCLGSGMVFLAEAGTVYYLAIGNFAGAPGDLIVRTSLNASAAEVECIYFFGCYGGGAAVSMGGGLGAASFACAFVCAGFSTSGFVAGDAAGLCLNYSTCFRADAPSGPSGDQNADAIVPPPSTSSPA